MEQNQLKRAIGILGNQRVLAKACNVTQQAVSHWLRNEKPVPAKAAIDIERATEGLVTRSQLRPDLFGEQVI